MNKNLEKTRSLVLTGLLFAIALVLSYVESALPPIFPALPGVRPGLSNIAVMYALFFLKKPQALSIALLKSVFVAATRGLIAGLLSLSGGLASLLIMILLMFFFGRKISYTMLSVSGAVFHNLGQITAAAAIYRNAYMFVYLPALIISGVAAGVVTAALLRLIIPAFGRIKK